MLDSLPKSILIHFTDGRVENGLLQSCLLTDRTLRYTPQTPLGERRLTPRVPFLNEVKIDQMGVRRGVDLSTRGMYVETLTPYPVGTRFEVRLRYGEDTIEVGAKAVFADPGIGMGLEFQRLRTATRQRLEAWVQRAAPQADHRALRGRRATDDRRRRDATKAGPPRRWNTRKVERRVALDPAATAPVEVEFASLKSVFFLDQTSKPNARSVVPVSLDRHVIVAFRDGEEIQGVLHDLSPETPGFFIDLRPSEHVSHTVYVVKSAVKSIQTIV